MTASTTAHPDAGRMSIVTRTVLMTAAIAVLAVLVAGLVSYPLVRSAAESQTRADLSRLADLTKSALDEGGGDADTPLPRSLIAALQAEEITGYLAGPAATDGPPGMASDALAKVLGGQSVSTEGMTDDGGMLIEARPLASGGAVILDHHHVQPVRQRETRDRLLCNGRQGEGQQGGNARAQSSEHRCLQIRSAGKLRCRARTIKPGRTKATRLLLFVRLARRRRSAWAARTCLLRPPGLVVTAGLGPPALGEDAARRAIGLSGAGEIRPMRLLPLAARALLLGRGLVQRVMQPAVPAGRDLRGFRQVLIDDPPARHAEGADAALLHIIDVAELVLADAAAVPPGHPAIAPGVARPPRKDLAEEAHGKTSIRLLRSGAAYAPRKRCCPELHGSRWARESEYQQLGLDGARPGWQRNAQQPHRSSPIYPHILHSAATQNQHVVGRHDARPQDAVAGRRESH